MINLINIDWIEISNIVKKLQNNLSQEFGDVNYTIMSNLWTDGDYHIECRHGDGEYIHSFSYDKFANEFTYQKKESYFNSMVVGESGTQYAIPEDLSKIFNR